jgi:hypothetical protein
MWTIEPQPSSLVSSCHGATIGAAVDLPVDGAMAEDSFADEFRRSLWRRNYEISTGFP